MSRKLQKEFPILEFDPSPSAIIEPTSVIRPRDFPEYCVLCFFQEVVEKLALSAKLIRSRKSELGRHPIYEIEVDSKRVAVFQPGIGAPLAALLLEEAIALGGKKFIACGGAGSLGKGLNLGQVVVPISAVRDEGTSYHYLPPSREVMPSLEGVRAIEQVLTARGVSYITGKTWTTDGIYRETAEKVSLRKEEGCLCVEMECSAFFAVAHFRGVTFGQLLYAGDDLSSEQWDSRGWQKEFTLRDKLFWLATEACVIL